MFSYESFRVTPNWRKIISSSINRKRYIQQQVTTSWREAILLSGLVFLITLCVSCTAQPPQTQGLITLRRVTKKGKLPSESVVANLEARFSGTKIGALARLLRARIRLKKNDPNGAAQILNSNIFNAKTALGDYALWLRGKSLLEANRDAEARKVFSSLIKKFPKSLRVRDSMLLWANSLIEATRPQRARKVLKSLIDVHSLDALLLIAKGYEKASNQNEAARYYRKIYFYGAGTEENLEAEKWLNNRKYNLRPQIPDEILSRANNLFKKRQYMRAVKAYNELSLLYPSAVNSSIQLKRLTALTKVGQMRQAQAIFDSISLSAKEKPEGFYRLALGFAVVRQWNEARKTADQMRMKFSKSRWMPRTYVDLGMIASKQHKKSEEAYFFKTVVNLHPNSIEVTRAQFELAWREHKEKNYRVSSKMLIEHLARYVHKNNSYRGRAGYWAARDSERAGKIDEACALYEAVIYRYGASWYGYLGLKRLTILRRNQKCQKPKEFSKNSPISKAILNMRVVKVADETATAKELALVKKSEELSAVGLLDWAEDELIEARKTAGKSPKINLALAKNYRLKGDNVRALLALKDSYPNYPQMFPEEMGREEWDIFYPLMYWSDIKYWAARRQLDPYQIAGLIRQETIFDPNAKSRANAYGLMQLLVPTARAMAKKYSSVDASGIYGPTLYNPLLNIELGTAYMREQLDKYGHVEYMSVAYNAGPSRVAKWRRELSLQMDEFVEKIPFAETRGYVKGIIRNSAQYRRLYDFKGNFKSNVGTKTLVGRSNTK